MTCIKPWKTDWTPLIWGLPLQEGNSVLSQGWVWSKICSFGATQVSIPGQVATGNVLCKYLSLPGNEQFCRWIQSWLAWLVWHFNLSLTHTSETCYTEVSPVSLSCKDKLHGTWRHFVCSCPSPFPPLVQGNSGSRQRRNSRVQQTLNKSNKSKLVLFGTLMCSLVKRGILAPCLKLSLNNGETSSKYIIQSFFKEAISC